MKTQAIYVVSLARIPAGTKSPKLHADLLTAPYVRVEKAEGIADLIEFVEGLLRRSGWIAYS
jgi:hypothetical protein